MVSETDILSPLQKRIIHEFSTTSLRDDFFLAGGTALSAFYLKHRYSEDLDFFTEVPRNMGIVPGVINGIADKLAVKVDFTRTFENFVECFFAGDRGETVKMDFAYDSPYRLQTKQLIKEFNVFVDNPMDIGCNKLSALYDRFDAKDFVDIFFIDRELIPFKELLGKAKKKHIGLDEYWLAQAFYQMNKIEKLPRMVKPVTIQELRLFFNSQAESLINGLFK